MHHHKVYCSSTPKLELNNLNFCSYLQDLICKSATTVVHEKLLIKLDNGRENLHFTIIRLILQTAGLKHISLNKFMDGNPHKVYNDPKLVFFSSFQK